MISKIIKTLTSTKFRLTVIRLAITACTIAMSMCGGMLTFAANNENTAPTGIGGTTTMNTMITIVFWVVRIILIFVGGVPGGIKIVQGQSDENPRDRNAGLATIGITGAVFAVTFAIEALVKQQ
ncbi:MAG: hypothetical protein K2K91_08340 [Ruminococcus sp.]|nr:hypothetical protein [Ruminococcus sp.]